MNKVYEQMYEGEEVEIVNNEQKICCCDCGLVHKLKFRMDGNKLFFIPYVDKRATAQIRRHLKSKEAK